MPVWKSIAAISNKLSGAHEERAELEPELISSVTGRERAKRRVVGFNDLPPNLVKAITVTEDRSFFEHHGINFRGIIRALLRRYDTDPNSPLANQAVELGSFGQRLIGVVNRSESSTLGPLGMAVGVIGATVGVGTGGCVATSRAATTTPRP